MVVIKNTFQNRRIFKKNGTSKIATSLQLIGKVFSLISDSIEVWSWMVVSAPTGTANPHIEADAQTAFFTGTVQGQYILSLGSVVSLTRAGGYLLRRKITGAVA